jgi:hypothetical protein
MQRNAVPQGGIYEAVILDSRDMSLMGSVILIRNGSIMVRTNLLPWV